MTAQEIEQILAKHLATRAKVKLVAHGNPPFIAIEGVQEAAAEIAEEVARLREDWIDEILGDLLVLYVDVLLLDRELPNRKLLCEEVVAMSKKLARQRKRLNLEDNGPLV